MFNSGLDDVSLSCPPLTVNNTKKTNGPRKFDTR